MSSGPCADCFSGTVSENTPTGSITTIHHLPTYVTAPEDGVKPKGLVVIITDAFGYKLVNNQVLADRYAKMGGFLVYVPDFMNGNAMNILTMAFIEKIRKPASWFTTIFVKPFLILRAMTFAIPFIIKNRTSVLKPRVLTFFQALRSSPPPFPTTGPLEIGVAGFCYGGRYAIMLAADTPSSRAPAYSPDTSSAPGPPAPLIDCAFAAHPSMLSVPDDIQAVTRPLSVAVGDKDAALGSGAVVKMHDILEKKGDDHECVVLPGATHGFAVRMDPKDELQMGFAATAEKQAINWFTKWFS